MEIGERIRQIRIHKGMTQTELINGICSNTYISKIESGKAKPSYSFIVKIAKVLEVDTEFLLNVNMKNAEPDVCRIFESYISSGEIDAQDLALLKLHSRENHSNSTLIKIYYVLISHYTASDTGEAQQLIDQAKNMISPSHSSQENEISYYFHCVSRYFYRNKRYAEALHYSDLYVDSLQNEGTSLRAAKAYLNLAQVRTKMDEDLELARLYTKKALQIFKDQNFKGGIANSLSQLAIQYHQNDLYDDALKTLDELSQFSKEVDEDYYAPILTYNYGRVYQKQKKFDQAVAYLLQSIEYDLSADKEEETIHAIKVLSEINIEKKNWEEADEYLKKGFRLTTLYNLPNSHIQLLYLRAQIYKARFDFPSYEKELQQAVQLAQEGNYPLLIKEISTELAEHYNEARAYKMAAKYYQFALLR
jgi:transcriptional regulator with XRE-family HTH domain